MDDRKNRLLCVVGLVLIMVLGAWVRLYGIQKESVWFDEFTSLVFLNAPDAYTQSPYYEHWQQEVFHQPAHSCREFLRINHKIDPATMPVYDAIEYFWNTYISREPLTQRILSVFFGLLIIPLIYVFGRELQGTTTGLIAAFLVAMSPIHRHFAQEIHMYVHMTLLALASAYTLFRLLRDGGTRWWVLHIAVNLMLVWTHAFGAIVPAVEGGFFVLFYWRRFKPLCIWMACHVAIAVPFVLFLTTIQFWSPETTASWQKVPTRPEFIGDLFADDFTGMTYQLRGTPTALEWLLQPAYAQALTARMWQVGRVAMWALIATVVALGIKTLLDWLKTRKRGVAPPLWQWYCFLVIFWLVPPLLLYVASVVWRPLIFPRYTTYCSLAAYLMVGMAIASIRWRPVRVTAIAVLGVLYAYEMLLVIGEPQRTSWLDAGQHIRANVKNDDLLLAEDWMRKRVFAYNLGPIENVLTYAKSPQVMAEAAAFYLGLDRPPKTPGAGRPCVWIAYETFYFGRGPWGELDRELTERGLTFSMTEFPGIQHVLVYKVEGIPNPPAATPKLPEEAPTEFGDMGMEFWRVKDYDAAIATARKAIEIDPNYSRAYSYLGMAYKDKGDADNALAAFQKAVQLNPSDYLWSHVNIATLLTDKGDYDGAILAIQRALDIDPKYGWAFVCLGKAYVSKREYDKAIDAFQKAIALDPNDVRPRDELRSAIALKDGTAPESNAATGQPSAANTGAIATNPAPAAPIELPSEVLSRTMAQLQAGDGDGALTALRDALKTMPKASELYVGIGIVLLARNDDMGALVSMRKAYELDPTLRTEVGPLISALLERKDYNAAWAEVKRLRAADAAIPAPILDRLRRDSGRQE